MDKTTMLELLEKVSNEVKDCWKKDEDESFSIKDDTKKTLYADKIVELMEKAVFDDMEKHTEKEIASNIGISASTFSQFKTVSRKIEPENLKKVLNHILGRLSTEGNWADDKTKKRVGELLFCIFRREEVQERIEHFKILPENNGDDMAERHAWGHSQELLAEKIFGALEQEQKISYKDFFIDSGIMEEEMKFYKDVDILFNEYRAEDDSKRHVVIFDVKRLGKEYLHQRIRCLQRKDNVFAVLMVKKGECYDEIEFYQGEHSNIMLIEYKEVREENSEICSYDYLRGICSSWYDEKCRALMTECINKIVGSHK